MSTDRRGPGRLIKILGVFAVLVILVILLAPTLVSRGLGSGAIRNAIEGKIAGSADYDALRVGWTAPQRIEGLKLTDVDGLTAIDVDITLNTGLIGLLRQAFNPLVIDIAGTVKAELYADGSNSLKRLTSANDLPEEPPAPDDGGALLAGVPHVVVNVDDLRVELSSPGTGDMLVVDGLEGDLKYEPGGSATLELTGRTSSDGRDGAIEVHAALDGLFDGVGAMTPAGAGVHFDIMLRELPLLFTATEGHVSSFTLSAVADDLSDRLELEFESDAALAGQSPSRLQGALTIAKPVADDGTFDVSLDSIEGSVIGTRVPTALIEPLLVDLPIQAERDIGPMVDVTAEFPAVTPGSPRDVAVSVNAEYLKLSTSARIDDRGAVEGKNLLLEAVVHPALAEAAAGLTLDRSAQVVVSLDGYALPPRGEDGALDLREISATGELALRTPVAVSREGERPFDLRLGASTLSFDSAALGEAVQIQGAATLDGGRITVNERLANLFDDDGKLAPAGASIAGTVEARGIPGGTVAQFLTTEETSIYDELLTGTIDATLTNTVLDGATIASIDVTGERLAAKVDVEKRDVALSVGSMSGSVILTPALAAALQESEDPITLVEPATATFSVEPFSMPAKVDGGYDMPSTPILARIEMPAAAITGVAGTVEPIALRNLTTDISALFGDQPQYTAKGQTVLRRHTSDQRITKLGFDAALAPGAEQPLRSAVIEARELSVRSLEATLGKEDGTYSDWLGNKGDVIVRAGGDGGTSLVTLEAALPNVSGSFAVDRTDEFVNVTSENAQMTLREKTLRQFLSGDSADEKSRVQVHGDMPVTFTLEDMRLPTAMLAGKPFEPRDVDFDARLTGGPLSFTTGDGVRTTLDGMQALMESDDLRRGVRFSLRARAQTEGVESAGEIDIDGTIRGLVSDESVFDPSGNRLELAARGEGLPTIVPDAFGQLDGLLVAAIGSMIDTTIAANDFSPNSGQLTAGMQSPLGRLDATVRGADNAYYIDEGTPLTGELALTSELGMRLLSKIHPLLADVRSTEQPMRATVSNAVFPADKDLSRLNADILLEIGAVDFDSGSLMLTLLKFSKTSNTATIPGYFEPIRAKIRNGVVTYERFAVRLDKYTLIYTGQVDLNTQQVALGTEIPLDGLAQSVKELRGYVDDIVVPLVTTGRLGTKLETKIDPDFDLAGQAVQSGIGGILDQTLKDEEIPVDVGGLLGDIFGGGKKDEEGEEKEEE